VGARDRIRESGLLMVQNEGHHFAQGHWGGREMVWLILTPEGVVDFDAAPRVPPLTCSLLGPPGTHKRTLCTNLHFACSPTPSRLSAFPLAASLRAPSRDTGAEPEAANVFVDRYIQRAHQLVKPGAISHLLSVSQSVS